jgi:hypothetical protein
MPLFEAGVEFRCTIYLVRDLVSFLNPQPQYEYSSHLAPVNAILASRLIHYHASEHRISAPPNEKDEVAESSYQIWQTLWRQSRGMGY